jgi:hypothetical protein
MLKSRPDRCGAVVVSIHWLSAVLILALVGSGFRPPPSWTRPPRRTSCVSTFQSLSLSCC